MLIRKIDFIKPKYKYENNKRNQQTKNIKSKFKQKQIYIKIKYWIVFFVKLIFKLNLTKDKTRKQNTNKKVNSYCKQL